ncbi:MAG TPA: proton-conducting transporter membrane subunit, partial [Bacteroidia bacterium]|nr:proton-conducting transporter membrane subunit [Bacteroidia bacterium]
ARSLILYAYAYSAASIGAFAFLIILINQLQTDHQDALKGLAYSNPLLAIFLAVILISLAGIPPTAGFFAKYYLFTTLISQGYVGLVIIAVLSSLIGVYFYLRPIIFMFQHSNVETKLKISQSSLAFFALVTLIIVILGFMPQLIIEII